MVEATSVLIALSKDMIGTETLSTHMKALLTACSWFCPLASTKVVVETYWDTIIVPGGATFQFIWNCKALCTFVSLAILTLAFAFLAFSLALITNKLVVPSYNCCINSWCYTSFCLLF